MTKKRHYLISAAVLAACVCLAFGIVAILPLQPGVTKANFDRIEKGTTEAEVARLFGVPPLLVMNDGPRKMMNYNVNGTDGDWALARIMFDENGRVFDKMWSGPVPDTFIQRFKDWIKGQSHD